MSSYPLISIIVPVHNSEEYLLGCLDSISTQTYQNIEVIVVNDDSIDGSENIIRKWTKKDSRISLISTKKHNAALARKEGIECAKGEYICFVDSDDLVHADYVETLYKSMIQYDAEISTVKIAAFQEIDEITDNSNDDGGGVGVCSDLATFFFKYYLWNGEGDFIPQSINAKLFKRRTLQKIDYSVLRTSILEDNYILPQIFSKTTPQEIILVDRVMYYYRKNHNSTMAMALSDNIQYDQEQITYPELFDRTMQYIGSVFKNHKGVEDKINLLKARVYYDLAVLVVQKNTHISNLNQYIARLEAQKSTLMEEVKTLADYNGSIIHSKSYRIGRLLTLPMRFIRKIALDLQKENLK